MQSIQPLELWCETVAFEEYEYDLFNRMCEGLVINPLDFNIRYTLDSDINIPFASLIVQDEQRNFTK